MARQPVELSLFWRTFFLLARLLTGGIFAWVQTLRALEFEPRAVQAAQQTADLVNLSRTALLTVDAINRVALIKSMGGQNSVRVVPREPADAWESYATDRFSRNVTFQLLSRLGADAVVARSVNGKPGMWVGFSIDNDRYWLQSEPAHAGPLTSSTWFVWVGIALLAMLVGSVVIARLINRPLRNLSFAASRIREGDLDSRLDENTLTSEIREVNRGFNRMARELAKVEEDRAVMLAGISHDLRTPLARLRLETEMSVPDEEAREHMVADIAQVDTIIDKFLDYARPDHLTLVEMPLAELVHESVTPFAVRDDMEFQVDVAPELRVLGDDVELMRVLSNLFENARRYGKTPGTGIARVRVAAAARDGMVSLRVRDNGPGVSPEQLPSLTRPFFRGDTARTAATGAGLGLAIVAKMVQNMGGHLELANSPSGGLLAIVRLQQAHESKPAAKPSQRLKRRGAGKD